MALLSCSSPEVLPADQVFDQMAKRQMADLRLGLTAKIGEDKEQEHRLTVLKRELDKELQLLRGIVEAFDAHASPDQTHVAHVTSRCLALRAGLIYKVGQELDGGSALLVGERERQADMWQQAEQHRDVVHQTLMLLSSYLAEVTASLDAKREALQIEKQCLVQGSTCAAGLLGPTEVDGRGKPNPSRNPPSPPPGLRRALSMSGGGGGSFSSPGSRRASLAGSPTRFPANLGPPRSPPLSPAKGSLIYRGYAGCGSPHVSPIKRGSFSVGYTQYTPTYAPPPLIPGRPRTPSSRSSSSSPNPRRPPSPSSKRRAAALGQNDLNNSNSGTGSAPSFMRESSGAAMGSTAELSAQISALTARLLAQRLSEGELLTDQELQVLRASAVPEEEHGGESFSSTAAHPACTRGVTAPADSVAAGGCKEETGGGAMPQGEVCAAAEDVSTVQASFDLLIAEYNSEIDVTEPPAGRTEVEAAAGMEMDSAPRERRRSLTDMRLDTAEGALHRSRAWRVEMQSKLSAFENEVRNDFLGTTAAIKDVIREAESELAQVNSRKLYVEQRRNKAVLQQKKLQQSLREKQLHLATLGSNLQALSRRRMVAEDDETEVFVMQQLSAMQGTVGAIDAEILSTQVETETLDSNHADLSSAEAHLKHLLDLDGQCLRLRQDHKARPQVAVPQALR